MSQDQEQGTAEINFEGMPEEFMEVAIGQDGFDDSVECMVDGRIVWDTAGKSLYLCSQSEWIPYQEASSDVSVPMGSTVAEAKPSDGLGAVLIVALFVVLIGQAIWSIRRLSRLDKFNQYVLSVLCEDAKGISENERVVRLLDDEIRLMKGYLTDKLGRED